jgi:hypothetical protein
MFEHKHNKLLPFPKFIIRVCRFALYSIAIIFLALLIGTSGYNFFGDLSWIDSFYNASMILTDMGPVAVLTTTASKLFSSFYALFSGIVFLSTVAILFAPVVHRFLHLMHIDEEDESKRNK